MRCRSVFFGMYRRPPCSTLTYTRFPYTTLFRSAVVHRRRGGVALAVQVHVESSFQGSHDSAVHGAEQQRYVDGGVPVPGCRPQEFLGSVARSEEHTSELQSLMRISYAVFCLKNKTKKSPHTTTTIHTTQYY